MERLEVIACFDWLDKEETIGCLGYDKLGDQDFYSFEYANSWRKAHPDILLGTDLLPFVGKQYAESGKGIFGCFADSLPDYWGRLLIELKYRQTLNMKGRLTFGMSDWFYLKGVEDSLRTGGFRFKNLETGDYLNTTENYQVPPVLSLGQLYEAAHEVEAKELIQEEPDRWIERLFKPGSSVGGARPKACVTDGNYLYIAKFPAITDGWDMARWEFFANKMAELCGIHTAKTEIISLKPGHDIFLSRRFDRTADGKRIHMASALSLLGLTLDNVYDMHHSYSEIADFIIAHGAHIEESLHELYRRVALTICIGNSDDHLKNHSFLLTKKGWVLSPVYDINPSIYRSHCLLIDGQSNESSLDRLYAAHDLYKIDEDTAYEIIKDVTSKMTSWKDIASQCDISDAEMERFADRFADGMSWRYSHS